MPPLVCRDLDIKNFPSVRNYAKSNEIDLVIPSSEVLLARGIVDYLESAEIPTIGPNENAARLEASKLYMKDVCHAADVPTAEWAMADSYRRAENLIDKWNGLPVIKADGLCGGKGVTVPDDKAGAKRAARDMLEREVFGSAGKRILIEEKLDGPECSVMALTDGSTALFLPTARDFKRLQDGDKGPNTGGMGSYSPNPLVTNSLLEKIRQRIFMPTLEEMRRRGTPVRGVLYAGLMLTTAGPKLLEWNVRFGDPEAQSILSRIRSDLTPYLLATRVGGLGDLPPLDINPRSALTVVAASSGYPGDQMVTGFKISDTGDLPDTKVFYAGVKRADNGTLVTNGGRVLSVTALGNSLELAGRGAYQRLRGIHFQGMHFRTDIAF
jgi:phosphoribosylamine--glycine ligase